MITKYDDFLLEKLISLINESVVEYSPKFLKLLKTIDSPISKELIDIENKDITVTSNYFDISDDSKDTISFIPDRKAKEILSGEKREIIATYNGDGGYLTHNRSANGKIFDGLGYTFKEGTEMYHPDENEKGKVISTFVAPSGNTFVYIKFPEGESVINKNRLVYDDYKNEVWTKFRQAVRTGRGVKALLSAAKMKFTDAQVEDFVNKYKSAYDRMNDVFKNFELVKGSDIAKYYKSSNYSQRTSAGTLGNSCMATVNSNYFDIYVENPDVCNLLILKEEGSDKIKGRALVWKLNKPEEITFMDRVYTHNDSDMQLFKDYAKFKKWFYKRRNDSSDAPDLIGPLGEAYNKGNLLVKIKKGYIYEKFPYVDTLKYWDSDKGILTTNGDEDYVCLEDTHGGNSNQSGEEECEMCGGSGRVDCPDCDGNGEVECSRCDGSGKQECDECDGKGEIECDECGGTGEIDGKECKKCSGKGEIKCATCDGEGEVDCSRCDGSGQQECGNCDGECRVDCPECS